MFTEIWTRKERGKRVSGHRKVIKGDKQVREKREMKGKEDGRKEKRKKYMTQSVHPVDVVDYFIISGLTED